MDGFFWDLDEAGWPIDRRAEPLLVGPPRGGQKDRTDDREGLTHCQPLKVHDVVGKHGTYSAVSTVHGHPGIEEKV